MGKTAAGVLGLALLLATPSGARMTSAPGFVSGPQITPAGLLWQSSDGQMLAGRGGVRRVRSAPGASTLASAMSDWIVQEGGGISAGRLRGRMHAVAVLHRCEPLRVPKRKSESEEPLLALSGATLYAVVSPACLHRPGLGRQALLRVSLPTGGWRLLARVPRGAVAVGASSTRVALGYAPREGLAVAVLGARDGRSLYRVRGTLGWPNSTITTQVDDEGDVLVTTSHFIPPGPQSEGWWATPGDPVEHSLGRLDAARPLGSAASAGGVGAGYSAEAALSGGRIAYVGDERLELLDLRRGTRRTVAEFPGLVGVLGVDLGGGELAWAQQASRWEGGSETTADGGRTCRADLVALAPVELITVETARLAARPRRIGTPRPGGDQPPCPLR